MGGIYHAAILNIAAASTDGPEKERLFLDDNRSLAPPIMVRCGGVDVEAYDPRIPKREIDQGPLQQVGVQAWCLEQMTMMCWQWYSPAGRGAGSFRKECYRREFYTLPDTRGKYELPCTVTSKRTPFSRAEDMVGAPGATGSRGGNKAISSTRQPPANTSFQCVHVVNHMPPLSSIVSRGASRAPTPIAAFPYLYSDE